MSDLDDRKLTYSPGVQLVVNMYNAKQEGINAAKDLIIPGCGLAGISEIDFDSIVNPYKEADLDYDLFKAGVDSVRFAIAKAKEQLIEVNNKESLVVNSELINL